MICPKRITLLTVASLAIATAATPRPAPAAPPTVGARVVLKAGAVLKVNDQVVDTARAHHIYTVDQVKDGWAWLVSGAVSGWAQASDVLLIDEAINFYTEEIAKDPKAIWAFYNRGILRHDLELYDQAIVDYSEALRIDPKYVPALINRGNAYLARKDPEKAIPDYNEALRLDPQQVLAYLNRGIALQSTREYDKAIADYNEAIQRGLRTAAVYNNRGKVYELKGDLDRAIADFHEALRLYPAYSLAYVNRAYALQGKRDFEAALRDYEEAARLDPRSPWALAGRAWILATCPDARLRDGKAALDLATKAIELGNPKDPYLLEVKAAALAESGDFEQAVASQTKAIDAAMAIPNNDPTGDRARLKLYQEKKPYRDVPTPGASASPGPGNDPPKP